MPKREWHGRGSGSIERALEEAEPAAEWLRTHPPGARLPDELEPGYVPDNLCESNDRCVFDSRCPSVDYCMRPYWEPESDGVDG